MAWTYFSIIIIIVVFIFKNAMKKCHQIFLSFCCCYRFDFIVTASCDGHVKFWKKNEEEGIEFVKHFRSHLGMCIYQCI